MLIYWVGGQGGSIVDANSEMAFHLDGRVAAWRQPPSRHTSPLIESTPPEVSLATFSWQKSNGTAIFFIFYLSLSLSLVSTDSASFIECLFPYVAIVF